jgi:hypothetical protein
MEAHIQEVAKFIARIGNRTIWRLVGNVIMLGVGVYLLITVYLAWHSGEPVSRSLMTVGILLAIAGLVGAIDVIPEVWRSTAAWKSFQVIVKALDEKKDALTEPPKG